jgi:hypothetical protein
MTGLQADYPLGGKFHENNVPVEVARFYTGLGNRDEQL